MNNHDNWTEAWIFRKRHHILPDKKSDPVQHYFYKIFIVFVLTFAVAAVIATVDHLFMWIALMAGFGTMFCLFCDCANATSDYRRNHVRYKEKK